MTSLTTLALNPLALNPLALTPLDLPGGAEHADQAHGFLEPLLGLGIFAVVLAALVLAYVLLRRRGYLPARTLPGLAGHRGSAEDTAKQILAERFARGDLSADEFMERSSALNWTPGVETTRPRLLGRA